MAERKNQHFVPQFLLRKFAEDTCGKQISLLLRENGKIIRGASIKSQSSHDNFYGSKQLEGFLRSREDIHSAIFRKLERIGSVADLELLDRSSRVEIPYATMLQRSRTEIEALKSWDSLGPFVIPWLKEQLDKDPNASDDMKRKLLFPDQIPKRTPLVMMKMSILMGMVPLMTDLHFALLKNRTAIPFVISDAPVVFYNRLYHQVRNAGVLGVQSPGLMIFFPISPETQIMYFDPEAYSWTEPTTIVVNDVTEQDVTGLNKLQIHHSQNAIYFSPQMPKEDMSEMWQQERDSLCPLTDRVESFTSESGADGGTRLVVFQHTQIPYELSLSFLDSPVLGDADYKSFIRTPEMVDCWEKLGGGCSA